MWDTDFVYEAAGRRYSSNLASLTRREVGDSFAILYDAGKPIRYKTVVPGVKESNPRMKLWVGLAAVAVVGAVLYLLL